MSLIYHTDKYIPNNIHNPDYTKDEQTEKFQKISEAYQELIATVKGGQRGGRRIYKPMSLRRAKKIYRRFLNKYNLDF